jgi:type I restriction enzyme S subunit
MIVLSDRTNCLGDFIKRITPQRCGNRKLPVLSVTKDHALVFQDERFDSTVASKDKCNYLIVPRGIIVQGIHIDEANFGLQTLVDEGIVSPAYKLWAITSEDVVPEVLEFYLRSDTAIDYYKRNFQGTTVARRQTLRAEDFLAMPLNLPKIDKQKWFLSLMQQSDKSKLIIENTKNLVRRILNVYRSRF